MQIPEQIVQKDPNFRKPKTDSERLAEERATIHKLARAEYKEQERFNQPLLIERVADKVREIILIAEIKMHRSKRR